MKIYKALSEILTKRQGNILGINDKRNCYLNVLNVQNLSVCLYFRYKSKQNSDQPVWSYVQ